MLRCKQVSDALASTPYWELPLRKRIGLRLHVALCLVCGPFNRYIMLMQDATRHYLQHEQTDLPPEEMRLSNDARERIARVVREERKDG
jgi:hypothetical protein